MLEWIQTNFPDIYKLGWDGQTGWLTHFNLTLYMTFVSFAFGGFMGLVSGLFLVLTGPRGVIANKTAYWILDKVASIFRAIPFIILLAAIAPLTKIIVGKTIGTEAALVPLALSVFPFFAVRLKWFYQNWIVVSLRRLRHQVRLSGILSLSICVRVCLT